MDQRQEEALHEMKVNRPVTMERFLNNEIFYFKMLSKFLEDRNYQELIENLERKDYEAAFHSSHTLKGLTANLGLEILSEQLIPMTEVLRHPPYDEAAIAADKETVMQIYDRCAELIVGMIEEK